MHVHVCVHVCMCMCACVHVCMEEGKMLTAADVNVQLSLSLTHWTAQVWTANSFMNVLRERLNTRIDPLVLPRASKGV